ncbi:hypothetical protein IX27_17970 [Streptomyces sp. JS01]|uniref:hypothetical protein n=1 Tax=Streptomyces sp. JS01 TaxID=1525753 RepID=UPI000502317C|nr:hypothetical protein [Streptomyces sp. JS01]KFK87789.1 hypothetical protein IX27_17970 [Streptomyces sp. JS01]
MADTDNVAELRSQLEQARRIAVTLEQENAELEARLEKYVGKEPTVRDEMAYLQRCANAVYELCEFARMRRHEVVTVDEVVQAISGERPDDPADKRRRIYIDGRGDAWLSLSHDRNIQYIGPLAGALWSEETTTSVRDRIGELHEIGRCW